MRLILSPLASRQLLCGLNGMNTLAHAVIAAAALSRPEAPRRNLAVVAGALAPDLSMFVFFGWSRLQGWSGDETWNVQYWTEPWQMLGAISNSAVLIGLLLSVALWRRWQLIVVAGAAALLHVGLDFPLHADDAHRHFWPLSDWRFASPVSYWDPAYNGHWGTVIETVTVLAATLILWMRFSGPKTRIALGGLATLQIAALVAQLSWAA